MEKIKSSQAPLGPTDSRAGMGSKAFLRGHSNNHTKGPGYQDNMGGYVGSSPTGVDAPTPVQPGPSALEAELLHHGSPCVLLLWFLFHARTHKDVRYVNKGLFLPPHCFLTWLPRSSAKVHPWSTPYIFTDLPAPQALPWLVTAIPAITARRCPWSGSTVVHSERMRSPPDASSEAGRRRQRGTWPWGIAHH